MYLYKIVSPEQWAQSKQQDSIVLSEMDNQFIHFATQEQVEHVVTKFWKDKAHLVLTINANQLPGELVFESNRPGGDKYYHLYNGLIPVAAVVEAKKHKN